MLRDKNLIGKFWEKCFLKELAGMPNSTKLIEYYKRTWISKNRGISAGARIDGYGETTCSDEGMNSKDKRDCGEDWNDLTR